MRLLIIAGERTSAAMETRMYGLRPRYLECDEIWTFCGKKQRRVRKGDSPEVGDQWVFVALDAETKLVPYFEIGKRTKETTIQFLDWTPTVFDVRSFPDHHGRLALLPLDSGHFRWAELTSRSL